MHPKAPFCALRGPPSLTSACCRAPLFCVMSGLNLLPEKVSMGQLGKLMCGTLWVTAWSMFCFICCSSRIWAPAMHLEGGRVVHSESGA